MCAGPGGSSVLAAAGLLGRPRAPTPAAPTSATPTPATHPRTSHSRAPPPRHRDSSGSVSEACREGGWSQSPEFPSQEINKGELGEESMNHRCAQTWEVHTKVSSSRGNGRAEVTVPGPQPPTRGGRSQGQSPPGPLLRVGGPGGQTSLPGSLANFWDSRPKPSVPMRGPHPVGTHPRPSPSLSSFPDPLKVAPSRRWRRHPPSPAGAAEQVIALARSWGASH